jgi:AraC-like DNA-binding protein
MKRRQFEPLELDELDLDVYHLPVHSHTYFEMIYVYRGNGIHQHNSNRVHYEAGDLFLISPEDEHYFEIAEKTRFIFIKFTDSFFVGRSYLSLSASPEKIMRLTLLKEMKLVMDEPGKIALRNTVDTMIAYWKSGKDLSNSPLMYFHVLSVFGLIREAMVRMNVRIDQGQPDKEEMISYIHQHIYDPAKTKIRHIASHFNISPNYFSAYFKRNFDVSYRDYVNDYRIKLVENRIASGTVTMKQIADEFGFTDASHLSHYFKQRKGVQPGSFRNQQSI